MKCCFIMDPISHIKVKKDTTFALMLEAQKRNWELVYLEPQQLFLSDNSIYGMGKRIRVQNQAQDYYNFIDPQPQAYALRDFDVVWMRKDPPFDIPYLYATYLLELAQNQGCKVINDPRSIRDVNEKLFTAWFPQCCPPTLVTSLISQLRAFLSEHKEIIVKPLNNMGGQGVFKLTQKSDNINATLEILTKNGKFPIMAQRFIPEIIKGDKRILMINGTPYPYALSRIPQAGEIRANLASGGDGVGSELTERDIWICKQVGPTLKENGLFFVGLDVIGDYLTEINVTSPTCVREIEAAFNVNICEEIFNSI